MILHRFATIAGADAVGRTVHGVAVPYGQWTTVDDGFGPYEESFAPGAFARSIQERGHKIRLFTMHETRRMPIGKAVQLREEPDGLHAAFALARTRDADEALELVTSGTVDGLSVGFRPVRDRKDGRRVTRVEAALNEVSLVHSPAYAGATIAGVRSAGPDPAARVVVARRRLELILAAWPRT